MKKNSIFKIDKIIRQPSSFDHSIIFVSLLLLLTSIVLISSASVQEAFTTTGDSYYYLKRQIVYCVVASGVGIIIAAIPSEKWFDIAVPAMGVTLFLLILVLIIGREVNEAKRWIGVGPINIQPAELLKLFWIIYFSSYTCRKIENVRYKISGFVKPLIFITIIALLLLLQPDFGSLVVVTAITFGILFVAGAGLLKYLFVSIGVALVGVVIILVQPYRVARVVSFLDPWKDEYGSGYQLTQSLMAFGRGGLYGEGIGNSVQKLGYLPEAHTDFVMAIMGEELGFLGVLFVIILEFILVVKAIRLSFKILKQKSLFQGYVVFGIGVLFCLQTVINIGAASGGLPTKGLTLPLISYGGSSLIVCMWALGILLRIDYEWRNHLLGDLNYDQRPAEN